MIAVMLILVALAILVSASIRLVRANQEFTRAEKQIQVLAEHPRSLAAQRAQLEAAVGDTAKQSTATLRRIEEAKLEKAELSAQLDALRGRKKECLYALERVMQPGLDLWEVEVTNSTYFTHLAADDYKLSWAVGRNYLVAAPSDREARRRAELKFLGSQGYRIGQVTKSRRF